MKKYGFILFILIAFFQSEKLQAQDVHFSQFYFTPVFYNPATTGSFAQKLRTSLHYKNQWRGIDVNYRQYYFSCETNVFEKTNGSHLGLALSAYNDKIGEGQMKQSYIGFSSAYHILLAENNFLSAGLQFGYGQRSLSSSLLTWDLQYDGTIFNPSLPHNEQMNRTANYLDVSSGLLWNGFLAEKVNINFGVSAFHLNMPVVSFMNDKEEKLQRKFVAHAMAKIPLRVTNTEIIPAVLYNLQGAQQEFMLGSLIRYELKGASKYTGFVKGTAFSIGCHYRVKDALILSSVLEMGSFQLGLSYDLNVSKLKNATNGRGGTEISLRFINPNPLLEKKKNVRALF